MFIDILYDNSKLSEFLCLRNDYAGFLISAAEYQIDIVETLLPLAIKEHAQVYCL